MELVIIGMLQMCDPLSCIYYFLLIIELYYLVTSGVWFIELSTPACSR